jgi:hypothetical protein
MSRFKCTAHNARVGVRPAPISPVTASASTAASAVVGKGSDVCLPLTPRSSLLLTQLFSATPPKKFDVSKNIVRRFCVVGVVAIAFIIFKCMQPAPDIKQNQFEWMRYANGVVGTTVPTQCLPCDQPAIHWCGQSSHQRFREWQWHRFSIAKPATLPVSDLARQWYTVALETINKETTTYGGMQMLNLKDIEENEFEWRRYANEIIGSKHSVICPSCDAAFLEEFRKWQERRFPVAKPAAEPISDTAKQWQTVALKAAEHRAVSDGQRVSEDVCDYVRKGLWYGKSTSFLRTRSGSASL